MAYYSIFPEKYTTIYSHPDRIHLNTGQDEILELTHEYQSILTALTRYNFGQLLLFEELPRVVRRVWSKSGCL